MSKREQIKNQWGLENTFSSLPGSLYTFINPTPVKSPKLLVLNFGLAKDLGLDVERLQEDKGVNILSGKEVLEGTTPLAQAYAGHQFGYFTKLGDGRAILLGEKVTADGSRFDIQLKGSGRTPYSRGGDGRAVLGPMLREYIISEAMNALGIPTSRSLAVVETGEKVLREEVQKGAILTRIASSHIRVGTFEYLAYFGSKADLKALADYAIKRHYPYLEGVKNSPLLFYIDVLKRQAYLVAKWQLVGFVHGIMNTDNMTISGETIDYGPCAFMDTYDPNTVFSSIDIRGRYAYGRQAEIAEWNLARFGEALLPLFDDNRERAVSMAQEALSKFPGWYQAYWMEGMRAKLGLVDQEDGDRELIDELLLLMHDNKLDYTNTFLALTFDNPIGDKKIGEFEAWKAKWKVRLGRQKAFQDDVRKLMMKKNPAVVPRNHRVEAALKAAEKEDNYSVMDSLMDVLLRPYDHSPDQEEYSELPAKGNSGYRTFCGT